MTILNVWIDSDLALIGVDEIDTLGEQVSKMLPLAHANGVLAVAGNGLMLDLVFYELRRATGQAAALFDELPCAIDAAFDELLEARDLAGLDDPDRVYRQEVVYIGWPDGAARPRGVHYSRSSRAQGFTAAEIIGGLALPSHESLGPLGLPCTVRTMARLAMAQKRLFSRPGFTLTAGGGFTVCQIERHGMRIERVCDLGAPVATLSARAASDARHVETLDAPGASGGPGLHGRTRADVCTPACHGASAHHLKGA